MDKNLIIEKNTLISNGTEFINLDELSDLELLTIVDELEQQTFSENSITRSLAKQRFGSDSLARLFAIANIILPVVAKRMKAYSPHIEKN